MQHHRRKVVGVLIVVSLVALGLTLGGVLRPASAQQPITLSVIDVAGDLASVQVILDNYKKAFPNKVKDIKIQRAPAPELPAKIKAQQDAGRVDINLILTGQDAGSQLAAAGQVIKLFPTYDKLFPRDELTEEGKALQDEGEGYMLPSVVNSGGPVFIYNPKKVPSPPKTADQLLAWAKANPGRFIYARPANSGPGRSILAGIPFIVKDKDPKDPEKGWDKTWAFLKELGKYVEYYPTGTGFTLKEFAQEQRWMIAGIMEWDMKPRAEGVIPPDAKITILENTTFVIDGHYWAIPKGVPQNEVDVILDLMKFMRRPDQQVLTYRAFIGPSIKAATLDKAPPDLQKYVKEFWRPEYDEIGKKWKTTPQLPVKKLNYAMDRWDREVGAQQIKK
ncbi:MAG: extracellular solute-binding protein [candidate division NC10 bacterium]|nr:extracellular solute-binding protein [candidate division NC10 bacterium]MBI2114542.1 extracellular solute-binding protein [candidate division NC10 bacterium]